MEVERETTTMKKYLVTVHFNGTSFGYFIYERNYSAALVVATFENQYLSNRTDYWLDVQECD